MKVKDLIAMLGKLNADAYVYVGCQGYSNRDSEDTELYVNEVLNGKGILISDNCVYETFEEE